MPAELTLHDICNAYPQMSKAELEELTSDIRMHGLKVAIVTYQGQVIDGRNRFLACQMAGVKPATREWDGKGLLSDLVVSLNERRRHLTASQKAMVAAELQPFIAAEIAARAENTETSAVPRDGINAKVPEQRSNEPRNSRKEAAAKVGASDSYTRDAIQIKEAAPTVAAAIKSGDKTITQAKRELGLSQPKVPKSDQKNGHTRVNGQVVADPPDIARARANGRIPAGVMVEISEPEPDDITTVEAVREDIEEQAAMSDDALSDEDWLTALPLSSLLTGVHLMTFRADALVFRNLEKPRKTFAHHVNRVFNTTKRKGAYLWRVKSFLGTEHPSKWHLCPKPEDGGCGGTGQVRLMGQCQKCNGRGYWVI